VAITAVVFDLGGVITIPPFEGLVAHERECGLPAGALSRYFRGHELMHRLERGEITAREFWKTLGTEVEAEHGVRLQLAEVAAAADQGSALRPEMLDLVRDLHGRYTLALLTNNVREAVTWREQLPHELFDVRIDSSEVGVRKPDPRIYDLLLERLDRPATEVVFIDDFEENLPPAAALGIATIVFESPGRLGEQLRELGVSCGGSGPARS
jgi:epoxide hydrolase-like predicted phosphatase